MCTYFTAIAAIQLRVDNANTTVETVQNEIQTIRKKRSQRIIQYVKSIRKVRYVNDIMEMQ